MISVKKSYAIAELIARAFGIEAADYESFVAYLDLYAETVNEQREAAPREVLLRVKDCLPATELAAAPPPAEGNSLIEQGFEVVCPTEKKLDNFGGGGGREKKAAFEKLQAFRGKYGLGCFEKLAAAAKGALSANEIRDMYAVAPYPIAKWRAVVAAIDAVEKKADSYAKSS